MFSKKESESSFYNLTIARALQAIDACMLL